LDTEERVKKAFIDALDLPEGTEVRSLAYRQHPKWTSLGHMTIVAALEDAFDCMLEGDEILAMSSFDKAVDIMRKYDGAH